MAESPPTPPQAFPNDVFAPEYYADQIQVGSTPFGFIFQFGLASPGGPRPVATVRMSPHHAKVMALILKRVIGEWESKMGVLEFPDDLVRELGLPDDL